MHYITKNIFFVFAKDFQHVESGESSLVGQGVRFRIGRILIHTPLGTWLGLGTQPHYKTPSDLWVKQVYTVINIRLVRLSPQHWGKGGRAAAK